MAIAAVKSDIKDSDLDDNEEDDSDNDEVIEEEPPRIKRRRSMISDEIILEDIDGEEEGDHESGNLASNSSTGAGSYNRESLIINPIDVAVASAVRPKNENEEGERANGDDVVTRRRSRVRFTALFDSDNEDDDEE